MQTSSSAEKDLALRVTGISKTFPGTRALDSASLEVRRGEIHALIGTNGSGKSTLIKILAGIYTADPGGEIVIGNTRFEGGRLTPEQANAAGLHFVHQIPTLFPWMTVSENIAIGHGFLTGRGGRIRWSDQRARTQQLLERFHIRGIPDMPVALLSPADRTLVVIARALQDLEEREGGVLILDEPTASLPGPEVERLLETLRKFAAQGQSIIYITHRLDEVLETGHRVTALRDGKNVGTVETSQLDKAKLVALMLGREVEQARPATEARATTEPIVTVRNLAGGYVRDASFEVGRGEILGIAGLVGSGAADVPRILFGVTPRTAGEVTLETRAFRPEGPEDAIAAGVTYVPPDRSEAQFLEMSVRANLTGGSSARYFQKLRLAHDLERSDARRLIQSFFIRASSSEQLMSTLSGGNQQKTIIARCLRDEPKLLLLDEPTQGVDVHARTEIHRLLREAARGKTSIIVVSSDFEELATLCDRVIAMVRGQIIGEVRPPALNGHRLTELAH